MKTLHYQTQTEQKSLEERLAQEEVLQAVISDGRLEPTPPNLPLGGTLEYQLRGGASKAKYVYPKKIRLDRNFTQKCPTAQNRFKSLCHLHVR